MKIIFGKSYGSCSSPKAYMGASHVVVERRGVYSRREGYILRMYIFVEIGRCIFWEGGLVSGKIAYSC